MLFLYGFSFQTDAQQIQALLLTLSIHTKYQCTNPGCSPSQILPSHSLRSCQISCLINTECRTATFSELNHLCEIFIDTPTQYGILTSELNSMTMIATDDRQLAARK